MTAGDEPSEDHQHPHHHMSDIIGGAEELPDEARHIHPIRLTTFVAVMMVTEVVDLLLTQRLHFAIHAHSTFGDLAKTISISANILFALLLVVALATLAVSREATPRFALYVMVTYLTVATVNVLINVTTLVVAPEVGHASQNGLILDLGLVYLSISLIFSLWYQVADTHLKGGALDFPPNASKPGDPPIWFDYFCVAFFTNSTFGPTLEGVRTRPAKALMMTQTALSLIILVVGVARIIKAG